MNGYFLDIISNQNIELYQLETYFENYNKDDWKYSNSGIFCFKDNFSDIKLLFINHLSLGFFI